MYRNYDFYGTGIGLSFNSERWMRSLLSLLTFPGGECGHGPAITASFTEVEADEVDEAIPLPPGRTPFMEGTALLGREVPYRLFAEGDRSWRDFAGFGRVRFDSGLGEAAAVLIRGSGIDPFYADIMFGHNVLTELLIKEGFFGVHASFVQAGGRGILFSGLSGSGKSTAAFAMVRKGHRLLADDRILLFKRKGFFATSLSDAVKLRRDSIRNFFPELSSAAPLREIDGECYYKAGGVSGWSHVALSPVDHIMVFERTGEAGTQVERIRPAAVVPHLFPVTMNPGVPSQMVRKFAILMEMLGEATCHRVYSGIDMDRFCAAIEAAVAGG